MSLSRELQTLRERQGLLRAQLARTAAQSLPIAAMAGALAGRSGGPLQLKRAQMSARYGVKHPDVSRSTGRSKLSEATVAGGVDIATLPC